MLIYNQLGSDAESHFAQQWGVGYAMDNASEWQDVCATAVKTALILVVLDLLRITKDRPWFEEHSALRRIRSRCCTCGFVLLTPAWHTRCWCARSGLRLSSGPCHVSPLCYTRQRAA
jgi:hypothetical protein